MSLRTLQEVLGVIRQDYEHRQSQLKDQDPEIAYDEWIFQEEPIVNELCLMLLVTLRHQIERSLVGLAALALEEAATITGKEYSERIKALRKPNSDNWNWPKIKAILRLTPQESMPEARTMEALRLIANLYKHDLSLKPSKELKEILDLPEVTYAPLPESRLFRMRLAAFLQLDENAPFTDIVGSLMASSEKYLQAIKGGVTLSTVKRRFNLFDPGNYAH